MIFRTPDINKKHELEKKGYRCIGMHTIYKTVQVPTGKFEWEFDLPIELVNPGAVPQPVPRPEIQPEPKAEQKPAEILKKLRRGNPNWTKNAKRGAK